MPRAGFVLVQPGTAEEERLRLCWSTPDRPERYFVPYTYVEACKIAGMLLKQIFVQDGQPIRMHIDSSIANINVRAALATRIMVSALSRLSHAYGCVCVRGRPVVRRGSLGEGGGRAKGFGGLLHGMGLNVCALQHSGGDPTSSAQSARVILADPNTEIFQHLVKTYQGEPDKYVESYLWVKRCIDKGQVIYTPVVYKNPGGRRPGEE